MTDTRSQRLDDAIRAILTDPESQLSAEATNALHAATSDHRWAEGKSLHQRAWEARVVLAGRMVPAMPLLEIERIADSTGPLDLRDPGWRTD